MTEPSPSTPFPKNVTRLPRWLARWMEPWLRKLPAVRRELEAQFRQVAETLRQTLHPYEGDPAVPAFSHLPPQGLPEEGVLALLEDLARREAPRWREGYASGAVYHGDSAWVRFLNRAYGLHSQSNPLHPDLWPSAAKFEKEIVAMVARMAGAEEAMRQDPQARICGNVTSGGTESILMAVKTYRDWARATRGITQPEMVLPESAHPAFDKAAHYFGVRAVRVPVGPDYRADVDAMRRAMTPNTILLVGSAPGFPHGVIDPIPQLAALARERGIGFHTDACLGGFILPWAEDLGYPVPPWDFRVPGVTSISIDTHKYGYAPKGTSVVLYRSPELRRYQYFTATDWPGGLYASAAIAGSRSGGLLAAAWAALVRMGEEGYREATRRILETAQALRQGIEAIPELRVLGDPLWVIAFASDQVDIYRVLDAMSRRGWSLNGLQRPPAVHIAVTLRHTLPGVAERFLQDLKAAVEEVKTRPPSEEGLAPIYGMADSLPFRGIVDDMLRLYLDVLVPPLPRPDASEADPGKSH